VLKYLLYIHVPSSSLVF